VATTVKVSPCDGVDAAEVLAGLDAVVVAVVGGVWVAVVVLSAAFADNAMPPQPALKITAARHGLVTPQPNGGKNARIRM
jgi:hypothetical protein